MQMATPTEAKLAQLWKWLLQKDGLGPNDDFFLVGGDSLAATQLVLAVNELFDVELTLDLIFSDASTIRTMAAMIDERKHWPKTGRNPDLPAHSIDERIARPPIGGRGDTSRGRSVNRTRDEDVFDLFVLEKSTACAGCDPGPGTPPCRPTHKAIEAPRFRCEKPPGTIRLAFLGDSFAFGSWNGGNETTWPLHVLETLRAAHGGPSYDYVNAAMPGERDWPGDDPVPGVDFEVPTGRRGACSGCERAAPPTGRA